MGETKTKKSKKSKKSKKTKKEVLEPEADVVDIDVPESESEDDGYYEEKEPDETEVVEVDDKIETLESAAPASTRGFTSPVQFTKAELPLLGYTFAALVFFLAAVGKRCRGFGRRRLDQFDVGSFLDELFEEAMTYDDDFNYGGAGLGSFMSLGCLRNSYYAYALCFGIFGVLFGAGMIGWMKYNASLAEKRNGPEGFFGEDIEDGTTEEDTNKSVSELFLDNHKKWINIFLFLWAAIGWAVFVFAGDGVFAMTGNGFFALWAMLLFSIWNLGVTTDSIKDSAKTVDTWISAMSLGSIITIVELTTFYPWRFHPYKGISSYGLAVSTITLVFGLVVFGMSKFGSPGSGIDAKIKMYILAGLLVLWIITACLTTFIGPFLVTGNGYFAVWGTAIFAGMAFSGVQAEL